MLRAILPSSLITNHRKTGIGRLGAGCGAGAGIACLHGADDETGDNVGRLASEGMRQTGRTILAIMTE